MTKRRIHAEPRKFWQPDEDEVIRQRYPHERTVDLMAALLGRNLQAIYRRARELGVTKSAAFMASSLAGRVDGVRGTATRFTKGQVSWNKGTHYVAGGRSAETHFKTGAMPHNHMPVGTKVKASIGQWKVKVGEPKEWRFVHRMVWEEANGPIPRGMVLAFKDGNQDNTALENLELITRREIMRRNMVHNLPAPLPQLIQLRGALVRKINRKRKTA